jgi:Putative transposase
VLQEAPEELLGFERHDALLTTAYKVLSRQFRQLFLLSLGRAFRKGRLHLSGELRDLAKPAAFQSLCEAVAKLEWVVYVKPPFGGPRRVLKYLARYTHRVAISNHRRGARATGSLLTTLSKVPGGRL